MTEPQFFHVDEDTIARKVMTERVRVFTERAVGGAMASVLGTLLLAWIQAPFAGTRRALAWLFCINVVEVLIFVLGYLYRAHPPMDEEASKWGMRQILCAPLLGIAWGSSVWFFQVDGQIIPYMVNLALLVAVAALTLTIVSPFVSATVLFTGGLLLPVLLQLTVANNPMAVQIALGFVVLYMVQVRYASIARHQLLQSLDTAVRNAALVDLVKVSEQRYRILAENSHDVIWTLDIQTRRFSYVSPSVLQLRGFTPEEVMAQGLEAALTPDSATLVMGTLNDQLARIASGQRDDLTRTLQVDQPHRDGRIVNTEVVASLIFNEAGQPVSVMGITRDITERKKVELEMQRLSQMDMLTGLSNRRHFMKLAEQELSRRLRYGGELSVFMMDLDHFKTINDTHGHQAGDRVLQKVGDVCRDVLRTMDCVGRIGGEEFAAVLPQTDAVQAQAVAERLREAIENASVVLTQGLPIRFTLSIGVTTMGGEAANLDTLLNLADRALYEAKAAGRNRVFFLQA